MEEQAADRVHRLGQTRDVHIFRWGAAWGEREREGVLPACGRLRAASGRSCACCPGPQQVGPPGITTPPPAPTTPASRYTAADSIEERMLELQERKRDLMKARGARACGSRRPGAARTQAAAACRAAPCDRRRALSRAAAARPCCRTAPQVAFDRRRPEEVRQMRLDDIRSLMEL